MAQKVINDINGVEIKKGDTCLFWSDFPKTKIERKFHSYYDIPGALCEVSNYISIDEYNDLSWWKYCEKITT